MRERQAKIEHTGDRQPRSHETHATVENDAAEQHDEHRSRDDGLHLLRIAEISATPDKEQSYKAEYEAEMLAPLLERPHILEPRDERQHECEAGKNRSARLYDESRQRYAHDTSYYPSQQY